MNFNIGNEEIEFNTDTNELKIIDKIIKPNIRTYGDMKNLYIEKVNYDKEKGLYFMFRGVYLNDTDKKIFEKNNMRYDITVIIPHIIGYEFNKTYGHFHPKNNDGKCFQEIYEILSGYAIYLQQNKKNINYTNAFAGDKVLMKEGFGHVTINPSENDYLIMANIVDASFESEYNEFTDLNGADFYYTTGGFLKNANYQNDLEINENENIEDGGDLYTSFLENPDKFNYLH